MDLYVKFGSLVPVAYIKEMLIISHLKYSA